MGRQKNHRAYETGLLQCCRYYETSQKTTKGNLRWDNSDSLSRFEDKEEFINRKASLKTFITSKTYPEPIIIKSWRKKSFSDSCCCFFGYKNNDGLTLNQTKSAIPPSYAFFPLLKVLIMFWSETDLRKFHQMSRPFPGLFLNLFSSVVSLFLVLEGSRSQQNETSLSLQS